MEGNVITMQEIFTFEQTGVRDDGRVKGRFKIAAILPRFVDRFKANGIPVPEGDVRQNNDAGSVSEERHHGVGNRNRTFYCCHMRCRGVILLLFRPKWDPESRTVEKRLEKLRPRIPGSRQWI